MEKDKKLLGDNIEDILKKIGVDKLAEAYKEITDKDCGCDKRKKWINNFHQKVKSWFNKNNKS